MPCKRRKKRLTGIGSHVGAMCPIRPNALWAMDFQFDTTVDGRTLKLLNVIDEFTRDAPRSSSIAPSTPTPSSPSSTASPSNNGSAGLRPVRQRSRVHRARRRRLVPVQRRRSLFIDPGSPWQNAWIESFNGRLRDELLNSWQFDSLLEARVIIEDWRIDYNDNRPHTAHGDLTPTEFARQWTTPTNPKPHSDWTTQRVPLRCPGS